MLVNFVYPQFAITDFRFGQFYSMDSKPMPPSGQYFSEDVLVAIEIEFSDGDRHDFFCSGYWCLENDGNMKIHIHDTDSNGYDREQLEACAVGWMPMPPFPCSARMRLMKELFFVDKDETLDFAQECLKNYYP